MLKREEMMARSRNFVGDFENSVPRNFFFVRRNFENVRQNRLRLRRMQIFSPKIIDWRKQSR